GKGGTKLTPGMSFEYAKNPNWKKNHFDIWGFYKSDYEDLGDENLSRIVTLASAQNVDAWSLSKIHTSLGSDIEIEYDSDRYKTPVLYKNKIVQASNYLDKKFTFNGYNITSI